ITDQWPGKLQKNSYGPSPLIALAGKVTEVVPPPPTRSVWAITRGSSAGAWCPSRPAALPTEAPAAGSEAYVITELWAIAATGSWPVWRRVMVNSVHEEGTVIEPTL